MTVHSPNDGPNGDPNGNPIGGFRAAPGRPETELLLRVAQQDKGAFAALFESVGPKVKGYLIRQGAPAAAAEEITQEVMLTIWRKAGLFDPGKAGALTWIFVIARNLRIDSLRRERSTTTYGATPPDAADEDALSPSDAVSGAERDERVRAALECLSGDQREVIRRSFFENEPHSTIAEALDLPLGTVKSRLRLAMTKLRERLEELR